MGETVTKTTMQVMYESAWQEGVSDRAAQQPILSFEAFQNLILSNYPAYINISLDHDDYKDLYMVYGKGYRK